MKTEQYRIMEKSSIDDFINSLIASQKVIGPVYKGFNNYTFEEIKISSGNESQLYSNNYSSKEILYAAERNYLRV